MALPKILLHGRTIILLTGFKDEAKKPATPSAQSSWTTRTTCSKPLSGVLRQLPSATWPANGLRLLKPLACLPCHLKRETRYTQGGDHV